MMTTQTSRSIAVAKTLLVLPLLAISFFLFSSQVTAQQAWTSQQMPRIESAKTDAPKTVVDEYAAILEKYQLATKEGLTSFHEKITPADKARLETLYKQMSRLQQDQQLVGFMPAPPPFERAEPGAVQFKKFKNPAQYGVWIDSRKVSNAELDKYSNTDFSHFFISRLHGAAKKGRSYVFQVDLMTNAYYKTYYEGAVSKKDKNIMYTKRMFKQGEVPVVR